jgi:hypothetical protein
MKRAVLPLLVLFGLLAVAPVGVASDRSLESALRPYKSKLTADIAYLANFKAPSKSNAGGALSKLSSVKGDLTGAKNAAQHNQASSAKGRAGRSEVIAGLSDALVAVADGAGSASAARSGNASTARSDAQAELREIDKAIPLLESGGMKLGLF